MLDQSALMFKKLPNAKLINMTQISIEKQIEAIINVTKEASKTKESARKFLVDAGIIKSSGRSVTSRIKADKK